jgi:hypothetical protein
MLRSLTVSHDHDASPHPPPRSVNMDKDAALVTTTVPDYHDGLHEKTNKSKHDTLPSGSSSGGGFQASPTDLLLEIGHLTAFPALYQPTRHQQLWVHTPSSMGGCWPLIPTCMAEWWSCRARLGIYDRWHWLYPCCYSFGRDGLHVTELLIVVLFEVADSAIGIPL